MMGQYLGSSAIVLPGVNNPMVLVAITCREDLALAADLSLDRLVIACDCKSIMDDIQTGLGAPHITIVEE